MIISILWRILYIIILLLCLVAFVIYSLLKLFLPFKWSRLFVFHVVRLWGKISVLSTGSRVTITGLENIPSERNICLVGNHQSLFDIPALLGWLNIPAGFIAKRELRKVPIIAQWMKQLPCVFIDRKNPRDAMRSFQESAEVMKAGNPIILFPEGTRAQSDIVADFKAGSLKLPQMAGSTIVPFAIKGTWRIFEIDKRPHSINVKIEIMKPISPTDELYKDKNALLEHLQSSIRDKVAEL